MATRSASALFLVLAAFLVNASAVMAQSGGGDPTKIGDNTRKIFEPNAKSFWVIALIGGLLFMLFTRKASRVGATAALLVVSGIAIWNPDGAVNMMQGIASRVL